MKKSVVIIAAFLLGISCLLPETAAADEQKEGSVAEDMPTRDASPSEPENEKEIGRLQVPDNLEIVVDPWEIDGRGQIYSERYAIKNTGRKAGVLKLSASICPLENSDMTVRRKTKGVHEGKKKSVYIKMVFGNGDEIVLSQEEADYQKELPPGEELLLCFEGELNENASESWGNRDMTVSLLYSWEEPEEEPGNLETGEKRAEKEPEEEEKEEGDVSPSVPDESGKNEKKGEYIELESAREWEFTADYQGKDKNGQPVSQTYIFHNTRETEGTLCFTDLHDSQEKNGEIILQTDGEDKPAAVENASGYEIKLKPGEEISVQFIKQQDGDKAGQWEAGEEKIKAVCSWHVENRETD